MDQKIKRAALKLAALLKKEKDYKKAFKKDPNTTISPLTPKEIDLKNKLTLQIIKSIM